MVSFRVKYFCSLRCAAEFFMETSCRIQCFQNIFAVDERDRKQIFIEFSDRNCVPSTNIPITPTPIQVKWMYPKNEDKLRI